MSRVYAYQWAETVNALEKWGKAQLKEAEQYPSAFVHIDTGARACRLIPVVPMAATGYQEWFPMQPTKDFEQVKKVLAEHELYFDGNRKSKPGFERCLHICI